MYKRSAQKKCISKMYKKKIYAKKKNRKIIQLVEKMLKFVFAEVLWQTKLENEFCTDCLANKSWKPILYRSSGEQKLKTNFVQIVWRTKVENEFCTDRLANKSWKRFLYRSSGEQKLKTIFVEMVWRTKVENDFCTESLAKKKAEKDFCIDCLAIKTWKRFLYRKQCDQKWKIIFVRFLFLFVVFLIKDIFLLRVYRDFWPKSFSF